METLSTERKIAALKGARDIIAAGNWRQGEYVAFNYDTQEEEVFAKEGTPAAASYCVMGAVYKAAFGEEPMDEAGVHSTLKECSLARAVFEALPAHVVEDFYNKPRAPKTIDADAMLDLVYTFNDDEAEQSDIVALLDNAIENLAAVEAG